MQQHFPLISRRRVDEQRCAPRETSGARRLKRCAAVPGTRRRTLPRRRRGLEATEPPSLQTSRSRSGASMSMSSRAPPSSDRETRTVAPHEWTTSPSASGRSLERKERAERPPRGAGDRRARGRMSVGHAHESMARLRGRQGRPAAESRLGPHPRECRVDRGRPRSDAATMKTRRAPPCRAPRYATRSTSRPTRAIRRVTRSAAIGASRSGAARGCRTRRAAASPRGAQRVVQADGDGGRGEQRAEGEDDAREPGENRGDARAGTSRARSLPSRTISYRIESYGV